MYPMKGSAQTLNCGTTAAQEKLYKEHPELRQQQAEFDQYVRDFVIAHYNENSRDQIIIPVVFHIIHDYGIENIPDANVYDQIAILNRDYNKLNLDTSNVVRAFKSIVANVGIEFRLAQLDPEGNCTNGIDRIASPLTYLGNDAAKLNPWDRRKYLNVWTVKKMENGVAGYAYKPLSVSGQNFRIDGIIILYDYIGSLTPGAPGRSRALTHEIGHWLNLSHPWGDNNNPGQECGDDGIQDTPLTKGHTNCNTLGDFTCDPNTMTNAVYDFDSVTTTSGNNDPTLTPTQSVNGVTKVNFYNFSAVGVSANSKVDSAFAFTGWDTGAPDGDTLYANLTGTINTSKYYQFSIDPTLSQAMSLGTLSFNVSRTGEGIRTFAVRSSQDNFAKNLTPVITPANTNLSVVAADTLIYIKYDTTAVLTGARINLGTGFANVYKPVTFRIYGFNAEADSGTFHIDNVAFTGSFGTVENVQNFMDYSYCSVMYTEGQKQAMLAALSSDVSFRNNLITNDNLIATGVLSPTTCAPKADFFTTTRIICVNSTVNFKDNSVNASPTSWSWSFPGGTPASSTAENPTVTYSTPGYYPVSLTVSNGVGSNSTTKDSYILVSPNWSDYTAGYSESFENVGLAERWIKINASNNAKQWQLTNSAAVTGSSSIMLNGFEQGEGDVDELITPAYDLRFTNPINLSFKYIGASKATIANDIMDSLNVYASTDCGRTWGTPKLTIKKTALIKAGQTNAYYIPDPADTWTTATVNLNSTYAVANVRFRFRYTSGILTNNFYMDDFNITGNVSLDELNSNGSSLSIFPNPFENETMLTLTVAKTEKVSIELLDITGRNVASIFNGTQTESSMNYKLEKQNLSQGVYMIKATVGQNQIFRKVIID